MPAMIKLTKKTTRELLGFDTDAELAAFFGITAAAVSQWPEELPIPELRQLQVERRRPDLFDLGEAPAQQVA